MKTIITLIVATFLNVACGRSDDKFESTDNKESIGLMNLEAENQLSDTIAVPPSPGRNNGDVQKKPVENPDWDKKIIKTGHLEMEVGNYDVYYTYLKEKTRLLGGYVAKEEQTQSEYKIENSLEIKVPVAEFDNAINFFSSKAEKISRRQVGSQDVTAEFVDTKSRMEAKKQVRSRYMDLLKQAKNMEEILNVQSEINSIQEEIEAAAGRIEYLGHSSSYSTIHLTFYKVLNASAKNSDTPGFGNKLSNAFKSGWSWVGDVFVGLVSIWPLFILIGILLIVYKKFKPAKVKQA